MRANEFTIGDYKEVGMPDGVSLMIADPVYDTAMISDVVKLGMLKNVPSIVFCSVQDLYSLPAQPEQTAFWVKQPSTKNTSKKYSCFVEPITFWGGVKFFEKLHWSTRTGLFFDSIIDNSVHEWKKPESLIEKLLRSHYPGYGIIYDPCAGSGTVHDVCKRLGIPSFSVEIDPKYQTY